MRFYFQLLWVGVFAVSCERQQDGGSAEKEAASKPLVTKTQREKLGKRVLSQDEFDGEMALAEKLPTLDAREAAIASLAWEYSEENGNLALVAMDRLSSNRPERDKLIEHFAMRFAEQDLQRAIAWAEGLRTPEEVSIALGRVSLVMAASDPAGAAHLISESGMKGRPFDVAVVQVIQRWAAKSPAEAAAWVQLFEPSAARSAGIKQTLSQWAQLDGAGALEWTRGLTDESLRRDAIRAMAEYIIDLPREAQEEWRGKIGQEIEAEIQSRGGN